MSAFVDSSVWFAAAAKRDAQNGRAKSILRSIDQHLTTDLVLAETWQLLNANFGKDVAESFWERLRDSGVRVEPVLRADLDAASEIEARFADESFSLIERTSFALMERLGITRAATFNPDFGAYRPRAVASGRDARLATRPRPTTDIPSFGHVPSSPRLAALGSFRPHAGRAGRRSWLRRTHGRALDRLGDGFRISEVILLSLRIGAHVSAGIKRASWPSVCSLRLR
jgi:predicted nucleic acid-binding protein